MRSAIEGLITLILAGIMLLGMTGCGGVAAPSSSVEPLPNTVDMVAANWNILYGERMPSHPTATMSGWQFDMPTVPGSVHYVVVPIKATKDLTGEVLTMTFRVASNEPVYSANVEKGESGPASFHLFLEHANDDFNNEYHRWWCRSGGYTLGTQDNQTITLSCPLIYTSWSSVYGKMNEAQFTEMLNHLGGVGVTFGGTGGWGHGVNLLGGVAQFEMLDARICSPAGTATDVSTVQISE